MREPENILRISHRAKWRLWLEGHFSKAREAWLVYPKKSAGLRRISYNDAVEEALCFGWIDSIQRKLDEHHTMQRFSPRNPASEYSQANKERLGWLINQHMVHPSVEQTAIAVVSQEYIFPPDILDRIRENKLAWGYFAGFSGPYKRIRIAYIDSARNRPQEFEKRLTNFIRATEKNHMIRGYGGIDKYY